MEKLSKSFSAMAIVAADLCGAKLNTEKYNENLKNIDGLLDGKKNT